MQADMTTTTTQRRAPTAQTRPLVAARLTEQELAQRWNMSPRSLQQWRLRGQGPKYLKLGSAIRYPLDWVEAFEAANARSNTSDPGPAAA
jgi:hypothetical protein